VEPKNREHSKGLNETQSAHLHNMEDHTDNDERDQTYTDMADSYAHEPYNATERTRNLMWDIQRDMEHEIQQIQNRNDIDDTEKTRLINITLNRSGRASEGWDVPLETYDQGQADDELEIDQQQQQNLIQQARQQRDIVNYVESNTNNLPHDFIGAFRFGADDDRLVREAREQIQRWGTVQFLWDMSGPQENKQEQVIDHHQHQRTVGAANDIPLQQEDRQEGEDSQLQPGEEVLDEEQLQDQDKQMSECLNNDYNIARQTTTHDNDYQHALIFDDAELMRRIRQSAKEGKMIEFKWTRDDKDEKPHQQDDNGEGSSEQRK
jgi:hypothetical protein